MYVPILLTRPEPTANINPHGHGFVTKTQTLIPANINEFTVFNLNKLDTAQNENTKTNRSIFLIIRKNAILADRQKFFP